MKETKIMKEFEQYIKKFDMNKGNIKPLYLHSLKMMELCKDISFNIGIFNEEEVIVCGLIGLFHNIAMFNTKSKDCVIMGEADEYSKKTIEILFGNDGIIRKITDNTEYDEYIKIAIYCQNKIGLPQGFNEKTLHYCKVIKDANAIEKFRMVTNYPYMDMNLDYYPNDSVYNEFKKYKTISLESMGITSETTEENDINDANKILEVLSLTFSINYKYSYKILKEEQSINKLIGALKIKDRSISKFFQQIASVLNLYINKKIDS